MNVSKIKRVLKDPTKKFYWPSDVVLPLLLGSFCIYTFKNIYDYKTKEKWDGYFDYYDCDRAKDIYLATRYK